ncbi:glycoside hydrolase family 18 [uncultured Alistipes sp.]|jgi:glycosyl hydrolase|uniref:glycoside hydrolase family 18 n=1 Tax=uncultured Alistipes sp. TaxID=538949 RepID=UPI0025E827C1|nr:glycoside hydrolase family 18 [uncultured Alistipes sp.]
MKKRIYNILIAGAALFAAMGCDTDPEALNLQPAYKYTKEYFENLRAYKESDHSICYVWFADYTQSNSMGYRFAGLPDSIDVVSLWGGIPDKDKHPLAYKEMWEMRNIKGTKIVSVYILYIRDFYERCNITEEEVLDDRKTIDPDGDYPDWCIKLGDYLLKEMWDNNLDGIDLDYEPAGGVNWGPLQGARMTTFVKYLGQWVGPMSGTDKMLMVDGENPGAEVEPYINYYVQQSYNNSISESSFSGNFPKEKQIFTENIGDNWKTGGQMMQQAAFQPSSGRKGGFGAFYVQRDYNTSVVGADKDIPYLHVRQAIQLQNPAVTK